jgi:ubiquitin-protein ligase
MPPYRLFVDTQDGELCYEAVEIGDDELVGDFLEGIIKELQEESGVTVAGSSAGDLRLICNERELDLSATLPEQGVEPNDTLRILAETFEGGGAGLRQSLIENDVMMLQELAQLNPNVIRVISLDRNSAEEQVEISISQTPGIVRLTDDTPILRNEHRFRFVFPRFYPEMPIACYCFDPLFHPNVSPETKFFCLWAKFSHLENNILQAICRAQAATALRIVNIHRDHWLNPTAAKWYLEQRDTKKKGPFGYKEIVTFKVQGEHIHWIDSNDPKARRKPRRGVLKRV